MLCGVPPLLVHTGNTTECPTSRLKSIKLVNAVSPSTQFLSHLGGNIFVNNLYIKNLLKYKIRESKIFCKILLLLLLLLFN
jgi:hypothetical protein